MLWIAIVAVVIVIIIFMANALVGKRNQADFAFASVDAQAKKRFDLVPNLVATCEKFMGHEEKLLTGLAETRRQMVQGGDAGRAELDSQLSSQLRSVIALSESYPELRSAEQFTQLQRALNETEEQLAAARRAFNAAVTCYNDACQMFPSNVIAGMMGYKPRALFEAAPEERDAIKVWH